MKTINWSVIVGMVLGFLMGFLATRMAGGATMTTRCVVGNQDCFRIRVGSGRLTATDRMSLVNDRLAELLGVAEPGDVHVETVDPNNSAVYCGHTLVVTITPADVRAAGSVSASALASVWTKNLASALK